MLVLVLVGRWTIINYMFDREMGCRPAIVSQPTPYRQGLKVMSLYYSAIRRVYIAGVPLLVG